MSKNRVYELAKELNTTSKRLMEKLAEINIDVKNHMALLEPEEEYALFNHIGVIRKENKHESENIKFDINVIQKALDRPMPSKYSPRIIRKTEIVIENFNKKVKAVYDLIETKRKNYGDFKKCEFHLHTPASFDYSLHGSLLKNKDRNHDDSKELKLASMEALRLLEEKKEFKDEIVTELRKNIQDFVNMKCNEPQKNKREHNGEYHSVSINDVLKILEIEEVYKKEYLENIKENIKDYTGENYNKIKASNNYPYSDFKEQLSYYLIAHKLFVNGIQMAVISDHNTVSGFNKLKHAIEFYYQNNKSNYSASIALFLGVEISCSEKSHVVGIFEYTQEQNVYKFLEEIIDKVEEGTYYPSIYIVERIFQMGGIAYVAHINSTKLPINKPSKNKLFGNPNMSLIGLTNKTEAAKSADMLKSILKSSEKEFCFIYEGDSHAVDEIGLKNTWIKFSKIEFQALKKAIEEHGICIKMDEPVKSNKYIKGLVVSPGEHGFLCSKTQNSDNNDFVIDFSQDLNCVIGGRGTGKSTIINIIDLCFTRQTDNVETLEFISKNKEILIIFCHEGVDFVLRFIPQVHEFYLDGTVKYSPTAFINDNNDSQYKKLSDDWIDVYKINKDGNETILSKKNAKIIMHEFYRRGYSINELVNKISNKKISQFINNVVVYGLECDKLTSVISKIKTIDYLTLKEYLEKGLPNILQIINDQNEKINNAISSFNEEYKNQIIVEYKCKSYNANIILDLYNKHISESKNRLKKHLAGTYLQWDEVDAFLSDVINKMGYLEFLHHLFRRNYLEIEKYFNISSYVDENKLNQSFEVGHFEHVNNKNLIKIYDEIRHEFLNSGSFLKKSILDWIDSLENFNLRFNVNYRETVGQLIPVFRDLNHLSMGQKVAALLSFVFNFGKHVGDNTPLIIDQLEDNLDNQYIYRNLIRSLKRIKNERQVIVVTHNSAIVTNADAEQVIVMNSDGKNGWTEINEYISNEKIIKHIINFMEGGQESLKNKFRKYSIYSEQIR